LQIGPAFSARRLGANPETFAYRRSAASGWCEAEEKALSGRDEYGTALIGRNGLSFPAAMKEEESALSGRNEIELIGRDVATCVLAAEASLSALVGRIFGGLLLSNALEGRTRGIVLSSRLLTGPAVTGRNKSRAPTCLTLPSSKPHMLSEPSSSSS